MKTNHLLRLFSLFAAVIALACLPVPAFAQRGGGGGHGGGGGGGFHGGGGGGGFHGSSVSSYSGGHYYGGGGSYRGGYGGYYRGGGYYGWRGGYGYGWRGGYWGYPWYGYGWGLGFGWPYYGWGYPYGYSYPNYYYTPAPYYDPNYCPPGYTCTYNGNGDPPPTPNSGQDPSTPGGAASVDNLSGYRAAYQSTAPILSVDHINATPSNYQTAQPAVLKNRSVTPRVEIAMRSLREMPPFAREREIETGRYSQFSPQEKKLLRSLN